MRPDDFIKLLNCAARFVNYGKLNVLAIFEWEQAVLLKQTGKQATQLKSYKKWNECENRIVSGKGVELDIEGCDEKTRFFDISQTSEQKFKGNANSKEDFIQKAEHTETAADIAGIGFTHKHRGLLLTALWMELSRFQSEYENLLDGDSETLLCHVCVVYIVHSHFKSNWQDESAVEAVFNTESPEKSCLPGAFFSQLFQAAINLIVRIEKRFESLVSNSESDSAENYYMRGRFYDICDKEKVAVCRLKPHEKINPNLSIASFEIIETLPYKPGMERDAFLEYLQSVFDNGLTLEHLVLVRRKNQNGVTVITTYRVDVCDWNVKQEYINFEIVSSRYPKKYYLRLVAGETLDSGDSGSVAPPVNPSPQIKPQPEKQPPSQAGTEKSTSEAATVESDVKPAKSDPPAPAAKESIKRKQKKERTNVMEKISKLKEDIQNKTC